ncbi:MAG TPA: hypothetical protein PLF81_05500 [Candidatus Anammoximicrobium sp.]|nr:hypothetical protein [Candidatus Anammoximicrobium sp.]
MRIQRQQDGWWITDVPCYQADGSGGTRCGPYATKADALDDKRGLERFFREQPVTDAPRTSFLQSGIPDRQKSRHWLAQSTAFRRLPLLPVRHIPSSPGQKMLPGMETD